MYTPVGIDVSAKTFDVATLLGDRSPSLRLFENTTTDHRRLVQQLSKLDSPRVVLEATGVYHLDLAFALRDAQIPLMVLNPKRAKDFFRARGVNLQTDTIDAVQLAEYAKRMDFVPWKGPSELEFQIFKLGRGIASMKTDHARLLNRLHADAACSHTPRALINCQRLQLRQIERNLVKLHDEQRRLILSHPLWQRRYQQLLTVKGIADISAAAIIGELIVLPPEMAASQWVKYAGLDPSWKQSGTSVRGKTHISHRGNKHLRSALFIPAKCARSHDPNLKRFAERLENNHKSGLQAIVAVARKMLHGIHAMFRTGANWDSAKLVQEPKTT